MKSQQYLFFLTICLFIFTGAHSQIPNSGFENWTADADSNINPDSWQTSNAYPMISVEQYTPAYAGNYSLKAKAISTGFGNLSGVAYISFPFTSRPTHLRACLKASVMPGDFAYIMFYSSAGDSIVAAADSCTFKIDSTISQFTCLDFPIKYVSSLLPDSATILISGGSFSSAQLGTEIVVDELSFLGVGIEEAEMNEITFQCYPNPVSDVLTLNVTLKSSALLDLKIYDLTGREVQSAKLGSLNAGVHSIPINTGGLAAGVYHCHLTGNNYSASKSFAVGR